MYSYKILPCDTLQELRDLVIQDASWYNNETKCIIQGKKEILRNYLYHLLLVLICDPDE